MRARDAAFAALSVVLFLVAVEWIVRVAHPTPRVQVIDPAVYGLTVVEVDGRPLWHEGREAGWARPLDCAADDRWRVVVAGDSVFHTAPPGAYDRRLAAQVARRLRADPGGVCTIDASAPAYLPEQQALAIQRVHADRPVDVAVVSLWKTSLRYGRLGPVWADVERVAARGGLPAAPLPVPAGVHRWALRHAASWRYATLALASEVAAPRPEEADYLALIDWADAAGVRLVFVEAIQLDRPVAATRDARRRAVAGLPHEADAHLDWRVAAAEAAVARGHGHVALAEALADAPLERIALDACCHFTADGHDLVADAVVPVVRGLLPGATGSATDALEAEPVLPLR